MSRVRALVGHRVLALLGRQVVAMATQHHDQRDAAQEEKWRHLRLLRNTSRWAWGCRDTVVSTVGSLQPRWGSPGWRGPQKSWLGVERHADGIASSHLGLYVNDFALIWCCIQTKQHRHGNMHMHGRLSAAPLWALDNCSDWLLSF